jgi:hypothetical protein
MRRSLISLLLLGMAAVAPTAASAQVYRLPTPAPQVSAASAPWQISSEPIFHAGIRYEPAGATVFFDGNVMKHTGIYRGVPIYQDVTIEPNSIVFVPVGRNLMRPYERRREGYLAGTAGSRTPSFPIQRDIELSTGSTRSRDERILTSRAESFLDVDALPPRMPICCIPPADQESELEPSSADLEPRIVQSIPGPRANDGMWIEFEGARWYLDGRAVTFDVARFTPVGNYRNFTVYRDSSAQGNRIFVTTVPDGPLAPFSRR